jgi:hypothetical protein
MISTVTTSTITTVTATGLAAGMGLVAVLTLISLLVVKELTSASEHAMVHTRGRYLLVGIVPRCRSVHSDRDRHRLLIPD